MLRFLFTALLVSICSSFIQESPPKKLRVLILDGQNNHNWKETTRATRATLEACGRFTVEVATSPGDREDKAAWEAFLPDFDAYDVVLSNFNDGGKCLFSKRFRADFEEYVAKGGGFVVVHAADNSSTDWPAYNRMIAVGGWGQRTAKHGKHLRFKEGAWTTDPAPDEASGSHGPVHAFVIESHEPKHPILAGLPERWMHAKDELYDSLRGPCEGVTVLASAFSGKTQRREPMAMTVEYEEGRVFHTPMGHVGAKDAVHCVGFQTVLARGTEWAATGKVTLTQPEGFPGEARPSVIAPKKVKWPDPAGAR